MTDSTTASPPAARATRRPDLDRFERIFALEGERMKSVAWNFLRNQADCEDAIQDAFLKVHRGAAAFEERSSPNTWIYRILVNSCLDLRRKRTRVEGSRVSDEAVMATKGEPASHPLRVRLERAIDRLDATGKSVFVLYEVEGFKHREIAEMLGIPEGTSKATLFRAKRELREMILSENREVR